MHVGYFALSEAPDACAVWAYRVRPQWRSAVLPPVQLRAECHRRIRFHDLRHTRATLLLKAGVALKVVSERLGHSTPAFTMTVYQHVLPGMQRDAASLFARLVSAKSADTVVVADVPDEEALASESLTRALSGGGRI